MTIRLYCGNYCDPFPIYDDYVKYIDKIITKAKESGNNTVCFEIPTHGKKIVKELRSHYEAMGYSMRKERKTYERWEGHRFDPDDPERLYKLLTTEITLAWV